MAEKKLNYTLLSQEEEPTPPVRRHARWNRRVWYWTVAGILIVAAIFGFAITHTIFGFAITHTTNGEDDRIPVSSRPACPQYPPSKSSSDERRKLEQEIRDELSSDAFFDKSLKKLQAAINVPTESFDDMGPVGEDPRWDIFADLHANLKESFPLV
jgi:Gly-Xaa carboxypeptidase